MSLSCRFPRAFGVLRQANARWMSSGLGSIHCMATTSSCDLTQLKERIHSLSTFRLTSLPVPGISSVLRVFACDPDGDVCGEGFVFNFGCWVAWDMGELQQQQLSRLVKEYATGEVYDKQFAVEQKEFLHYRILEGHNKCKVDGETVVLGSRVCEDDCIRIKLACSHALALCVNLSILEDKVRGIESKAEAAGRSRQSILHDMVLRIYYLKLMTLRMPDGTKELTNFYWHDAEAEMVYWKVKNGIFGYRGRVTNATEILDFNLEYIKQRLETKLTDKNNYLEIGILLFVAIETIAALPFFH